MTAELQHVGVRRQENVYLSRQQQSITDYDYNDATHIHLSKNSQACKDVQMMCISE